MDEQGIILSPSVEQVKTPILDEYDYRTSKGEDKHARDWHVEGIMSYTFINAENPEEIHVCPWYFVGVQDDPSKAFGSGLTYSERYFLLKFFGIPTDEADPDSKEPKNTTKSKYKFGYGDNVEWVSDQQVKDMVKAIKEGKKQAVIDRLCNYKWSKANKELITKELEN